MSRRAPATIQAIPTTYKGVQFRSRLEAKWACFMDALSWRWEYEPDLQAGFVIPDFALADFNRTVLLECKPEMSVEGLAAQRADMIAKMPGWLLADVEREIALLDRDDDAPLELTDRALNDLVRVACGHNPRGYTRRILVVGSQLFLERGDAARVTLDGEHGFTQCEDHVGLAAALGAHCLHCGFDAERWAPTGEGFLEWRESTNAARWTPKT